MSIDPTTVEPGDRVTIEYGLDGPDGPAAVLTGTAAHVGRGSRVLAVGSQALWFIQYPESEKRTPGHVFREGECVITKVERPDPPHGACGVAVVRGLRRRVLFLPNHSGDSIPWLVSLGDDGQEWFAPDEVQHFVRCTPEELSAMVEAGGVE